MSDQSGYELTPPEPRKEPASPPAGASPPAPAAGLPPVPPGFVPPVPIVEGPDPDPEEEARKDAEENRATACLAYIIFLLPLVFAPKSKFARYHANQGLLLTCCWAVWFLFVIGIAVINELVTTYGSRVSAIATPVSWLAFCGCTPLAVLMAMGLVVLVGIGIIAAANNEMKPLPVIGKLVLIKPLSEKCA